MHLLPTGTQEPVQPVLGLFLTDKAPEREPFLVRLESKSIDIPAGQKEFVVEDSYVLPADVDATSIYPHAHYLAKDMQATATLPDGTTRWLLSFTYVRIDLPSLKSKADRASPSRPPSRSWRRWPRHRE